MKASINTDKKTPENCIQPTMNIINWQDDKISSTEGLKFQRYLFDLYSIIHNYQQDIAASPSIAKIIFRCRVMYQTLCWTYQIIS